MTNQSQWSPPELEAHTLVLLRWPDELPELTEAELDALQAEHVAYQLSLRQRGIIAAGGPFHHKNPAQPHARAAMRRATSRAASLP